MADAQKTEHPGPCPFCGSENLTRSIDSITGAACAILICDNCKARGPRVHAETPKKAEEGAIIAWNANRTADRDEADRQRKTRPSEAVKQAELKEVHDHLWSLEKRLRALEHEQDQPNSDGWYPWEGGECPLQPDDLVEFRRKGDPTDYIHLGRAKCLDWGDGSARGEVAFYRPLHFPPNPGVSEWIRYRGYPSKIDTDRVHPFKWYKVAKRTSLNRQLDVMFYDEKGLEHYPSGPGWMIEVLPDNELATAQERTWPQQGDEYWYINEYGLPDVNVQTDDPELPDQAHFLGIYPTEEKTEEVSKKVKRIMDHLRNGGTVLLNQPGSEYAGEISL